MHQPNSTSDATYFGGSALTFPEFSPILPWTLPCAFIPAREPEPFRGLFNNMMMIPAFGHDGVQQKLTDQEVMDAKALAASKSHSEAERRRRERINNHYTKLRSLLPNTTKTDKASLLAEVIQHVKDLKRQTSSSLVSDTFPTETDELTVDEYASSSLSDGWMIRASVCCDDRSDLLPDLINTLKALKLRTLKAEITTLGGRVKNVLFVTGVGGNIDGGEEQQQYCISSIEEALRAVMEKVDNESAGHVKRQRTINAY